jgi:hypothetical protein
VGVEPESMHILPHTSPHRASKRKMHSFSSIEIYVRM